eukprot:2084078-Rhodomonas_salina.2
MFLDCGFLKQTLAVDCLQPEAQSMLRRSDKETANKGERREGELAGINITLPFRPCAPKAPILFGEEERRRGREKENEETQRQQWQQQQQQQQRNGSSAEFAREGERSGLERSRTGKRKSKSERACESIQQLGKSSYPMARAPDNPAICT